MRIPLVNCASDEQYDIVDHVCITIMRNVIPLGSLGCNETHSRDIVKELGERFYGVISKVVELVDHDLCSLVRDGCCGYW